jgi:hypothetical protein
MLHVTHAACGSISDSGRKLVAVEAHLIHVGRCYVTHSGEVRKVLESDGQRLTYVTRGKLAFPAWDAEKHRLTTKDTFARDVEREVPCEGPCGGPSEGQGRR